MSDARTAARCTPRTSFESLTRAAGAPLAGWLLSPIAKHDGALDVQAVGDDAIAFHLTREDVDLARLLSAAPLAIVADRDPSRHSAGTGAFFVRTSGGALDLRGFRRAAAGAPRLDHVHIDPPRTREDELRSFELGRIDASFYGTSLYGGGPVRPAIGTPMPVVAPVLLVPNRAAGPLHDGAVWAAVAHAIDRHRLERIGLSASTTLGPSLPAPALSAPTPHVSRGLSLHMPVRTGDAFAGRLAEALAGLLDEAGIALTVDHLTPDAYRAELRASRWDLRIATVMPPLPGPTALVAAAFAATGQDDEARALASTGLTDPATGRAAAPRLAALVLGRRRDTIYHRADLQVTFDALGRLDLPDLCYARGSDGSLP